MKDKERGITITPRLTLTAACRLAAAWQGNFGVSRERAEMVEPTQVKQSSPINPDYDPNILDGMFGRSHFGPDVDGDVKYINGKPIYFNLSQGDEEPFDDSACESRDYARGLILGGPRTGGEPIGPMFGDTELLDGAMADAITRLSRPVGIDLTEYPTDSDGDTALVKSLNQLRDKAVDLTARVAVVGAGPGRAAGLAAAALKMGKPLIVIDSLAKAGGTNNPLRVKDDLELMYPNRPMTIEPRRMHQCYPRKKQVGNYPVPRQNKKTMHKRK